MIFLGLLQLEDGLTDWYNWNDFTSIYQFLLTDHPQATPYLHVLWKITISEFTSLLDVSVNLNYVMNYAFYSFATPQNHQNSIL